MGTGNGYFGRFFVLLDFLLRQIIPLLARAVAERRRAHKVILETLADEPLVSGRIPRGMDALGSYDSGVSGGSLDFP